MAQEFLVSTAIEDNERYLAVGLVARLLFQSMIRHADDEGRAKAAAATWQRKAALYGAADVPLDEIGQAIRDLASTDLPGRPLVVLYDDGRHLFLPGRFEHNQGRRTFARSRHPLPPPDDIERFPEYAGPLARLTTKGRVADSTGPGEAWRYEELRRDAGSAERSAANCCKSMNHDASGYGEGVGEGVGEVDKKNPSGSMSSSPSAHSTTPPYEKIISHLNEKTGSRFRHKAKAARDLIRARWREGYTLDDFIAVIDRMCAAWKSDQKMVQYLRPTTLFRPSHFDEYLNGAEVDGRDARKPEKDFVPMPSILDGPPCGATGGD